MSCAGKDFRAARRIEMSTSQGTASYPSRNQALRSELGRDETSMGATGLSPIDPRAATSTILQNLLLHAPDETVTLDWLICHLGRRSFGIVLLLLGLLACLPGISAVAAVLIPIPAYQM